MNAFDSVIGYQQQHSRNPNVFQQILEKTRPAKGDTIRQISLFLWRATVPLNMSNNLWYFWSIRFGRKPILRTERHLSVWWILLSRLFVNILSFFFEGLSIGERTLLAFFPKFYSIKSLIDCNQCSAESTPRLCRTFVKLELELTEQKTYFSRLPPQMINVRRMLAV